MHELSAFTYMPGTADWYRILPELIVLGTALLVLLADLFAVRGRKGWLAIVGLLGVIAAAVLACVVFAGNETVPAFYAMVSADRGAMFADVVILFAAGLGLLMSPGFIERQGITHEGEYYALLLISALGMMLMASAMNLMIIFVGLEVLSLSLYVLCAIVPGRFRSQESGMKYFILSSFASAFLLYGMALTYGSTGSTSLLGIRTFVARHGVSLTSGFGPLLVAGLGLMAVGFCFKVSAVPFQAWTPDVYVGAPTSVTAFMSVGTKVAAFAGLARVFFFALSSLAAYWQPVFWVIAILTMLAGNLFAVTQRDVKRMLAYSSVANAGYILVAIGSAEASGAHNSLILASMFVYLACYAAMNVGAFGVVLAIEHDDGSGTSLDDFNGLARTRPALAAVMALFLFSLAGIPATAGFIGKWYVFYAAIVAGHLELAVIGVIASMIGVFYYLRVVWAMYFTEPRPASEPFVVEPVPEAQAPVPALAAVGATSDGGVTVAEAPPSTVAAPTTHAQPTVATPAPRVTRGTAVALTLAAVATLGLGIVPGGLVQLAISAANAFLR